MATRFYLPTYRAWCDFDPDDWHANWNGTGLTPNGLMWTYPAGYDGEASIGTARAGANINPSFSAIQRCLSPPLEAQTISGTIKGQFRCLENASNNNYTLAVGIRVIAPDGSVRGTCLAPTASDSTSSPPEWPTATATNRRLLDASESASITITSVDAQEGDRLEVVIGFRAGSTSTNNGTINFRAVGGDTDLAENDTSTATDNSWIEFSDTITFADDIIPWFIGGDVNPNDNGLLQGDTITLTPPTAGMRQGDLVVVVCKNRFTADWTVGVTGGQSWTEEVIDAETAIFWCTFDGTWDADPRFDQPADANNVGTAIMGVWRGLNTATVWGVDVAIDSDAFTASTTVTRTGLTTIRDNAVVIGGFGIDAANTFTAAYGSAADPWRLWGSPQFRNTQGSDTSLGLNFFIAPTGGTATGNLVRTQSASTAGQSFIIAFSPVVPQIVNLSLVTETDITLALTKVKAKSITQPSETDVVNSIIPNRIKPIGFPIEIDTVTSFDTSTVIEVGLVTETDVTFTFSHSISRTLSLVSETDTANSFAKSKLKSIGLVSETDTPFALTHSFARTIGLVSEIDLSNAFGKFKNRSIGLVSEIDTSNVFTRTKSKLFGLTSETDVTFSFAHSLARTIGLVTETDLAQVISRSKSKSIGLTTEIDTAFSFAHSLARTLTIIQEIDAATSITRSKLKSIGLTSESDTAVSLTHSLARTLSLIVETDTAFALSEIKSRLLGLISEIDTAFSMGHSRSIVLDQVEEIDTATPLQPGIFSPIGLSNEVDTAFSFAKSKSKSFGLASETGQAFVFSRAKSRGIGLVNETDIPFSIARLKSFILGMANELDAAILMTRQKQKAIGIVLETDDAFSFGSGASTPIGIASEIDLAQLFGHSKLRPLGIGQEFDTAFNVSNGRRFPVDQPEETDVAFSFAHSLLRRLGLVQEFDTALSMFINEVPPLKQRIDFIENRVNTNQVRRLRTNVISDYSSHQN